MSGRIGDTRERRRERKKERKTGRARGRDKETERTIIFTSAKIKTFSIPPFFNALL